MARIGAYFDAFVGNPPFAGKNATREANGPGYVEWLMATTEGAFGNTDLCAYFFRRSADLLGEHGTLGLVATNTVAQGDTRATSLKHLVHHGAVIYAATSSMPWPGAAAVMISVVHLAFGAPATRFRSASVLDGARVKAINSRLLAGAERPDPRPLAGNSLRAFMGGKLIGEGLVVEQDEYDRLLALDARNGDILQPFLGGEDINQSPTGETRRYAINFGKRTLEEAQSWPTLLRIVEERVRPERERNNRATYRTYWWRPGEAGGALLDAIAGLSRCIVAARVTKHLCFSFQPTKQFFNEKVYVFAFDDFGHLAVLQSRIHRAWAWLLSSTMKSDLNYSASDCFDTFPFPVAPALASLEVVGRKLYEERARYMVDEGVGLTTTYNRLRDGRCVEPRVAKLRASHEAVDAAVLDAYGWRDLAAPPFAADVAQQRTFETEVVDRLFALNAERAEEERVKGLGGQSKRAEIAKRKRRKGGAAEGQGGLPGVR